MCHNFMADLLLPRGMERNFGTYQHIDNDIHGTLFCRKLAGDYAVDAIFLQSQAPKEIADAYFQDHPSYQPLLFCKPSKDEIKRAQQSGNMISYILPPEQREHQRRSATIPGLGVLLVLPGPPDKPYSSVPYLWSPTIAGIQYIDESAFPDRPSRNKEISDELKRFIRFQGQTNVCTLFRKQIS